MRNGVRTTIHEVTRPVNDTRTAQLKDVGDTAAATGREAVCWSVSARPRGPLRWMRVDSGDVSVHLVGGKEGPSDDTLRNELREVLDAAPSSDRLGNGARQVSPRLLGLVETLISWRALR